jgi:tRNA(fMet)-specific endonuclease VapC
MTYLLDSNACIVFLNGRSEKLKQRFLTCEPKEMTLCSVVKAELYFGAMKSQNMNKSLSKIDTFFSQFYSLPFDDESAKLYGEIRADLTAKGTIIGNNDMMIAAIALKNELTLVTHNTREFSRVVGLTLEDWE